VAYENKITPLDQKMTRGTYWPFITLSSGWISKFVILAPSVCKLPLTGAKRTRHKVVNMVENMTLKCVRSTLLKAMAHDLQEVDDTVLNNGP
jgi:hypothetical protein